jgi:phosphatidylglycerophosphate synthase
MQLLSLRDNVQAGIYGVINPFVRLLIRAGLTPNAVTTIGMALNVGVAVVFIVGAEQGHRGDLRFVGWGGALILFAGLFDMLDGQVARLGNMKSTFGALYDSVLDRYSELFTFLGICYYLVAHHYFLSSLFAFVALIGSMMVSYTRARAEGLGIECKGGLMQRPERVVLLGVSALLCGVASAWLGSDFKLYAPGISMQVFETMSIFTFPVAVMAVMTNVTAVNRLCDARRDLETRERFPFGPPVTAKKASAVALLLLAGVLGTGPGKGALARPVADSLSAVHLPIPVGIDRQLFYLQRNTNTNTVIYQLNLDAQGRLNRREPVHVFWMRYAEGGQPRALNFIQRRFAYGLHAKQLQHDAYELRFVSYANFPLYLARSAGDNQYRVYATIGRRRAVLQRIFLRIEGGSFWAPNVQYVELKGTDVTTGADLVERIKV